MNEKSKFQRNLSDSHKNQILVLRTLSVNEGPPKDPRPFMIEEIAQLSGLKDEREIQRYLFILEGQKLVSPHPEGDFTSKTWQITRTGIRAIRAIEKSTTM